MTRWWLLLAVVLVSSAGLPAALHVRVDPGTSGWIDAHGPAARDLAQVESRFGRQDGFVVALFAADVLAPDAVAWQRTLSAQLAGLPGVTSVDSLATAQDVVVDELGPAPAPLLDQPRAQILDHPIYRGLLLAGDGSAAGMVAHLGSQVDDQDAIALETRIRELLHDQPPPPGGEAVLGGLPVQQHAIGRIVARDQLVTVPVTVLLLALMLVVTLPSIWAVGASLLGIGSALTWTYAGLALSGRHLDALLGLLPPLVLGIGVATSFHVIRALALAQVAGEAQPRRAALRRLRLPVTLATLTALAGVGGLWLGAVPAVRSFAPWAMLGVVLGTALPVLWLLAVAPLLPAPTWSKIAHGTWGDRLGGRLAQLAQAVAARHRWILVCSAAIALAAGIACASLRVDGDFIHALPAQDPARLAQERIDRHLTGTLGLDLLVDVGHQPTAAEVQALATLGAGLRSDSTVVHAMSLGDVLALVQLRGDRRPAEAILADLLLGAKPVVAQFLGPGLGAGGHSGGQATTLRLMARQQDGSVATAADVARRLRSSAATLFPSATVTVASAALLLDETTHRLLPATALSVLVSKLAVILLLVLFVRRWRLALLAVVLVGLPLLITYGVIPLLGWPLDVGVSMIACIALGMIMNDTIHLVDALHRCGMAAAYRQVGPAVALAGIALAVAFSACELGSFGHTRRFGILLMLAFLTGLLVNLIVAPALIRILQPPVETLS